MKLGKLAPGHDSRDLLFSTYRTGAPLPPHPKTFGHDALVKTWGLLGNDELGDCAPCMIAHWLMLLAAETGVPIDVTKKSVVELYSAVTGYDPADPNTDQGTMLRDLLKFMRETGFRDGAGKVHKIEAFVKVNHRNLEELEEAMWLFGGLMIGVQLPESAQTQFGDGKVWSVVKGSPIEGGHAILGAGLGTKPVGFLGALMSTLGLATAEARVITWGQDQPATTDWLTEYIDEAWVCLSGEQCKDGKTLEGFDLETLRKDLAAVAA